MAYFDSVLNTRMILAAATEAGLEAAALLQAAGIDPALLEKPFAKVPVSDQFALLEAAVGRSGDPAFGLRMARCWNRPGAMEAVGYRIAASGTFRDMIEAGYDGLRRFSNLQEVHLEDRGDIARIIYRPGRRDWPAWSVLLDFYMANVVIHGRWLVDPDFAPLEAAFVGTPPATVEPYEAVFRCRLRFDHPWGELVLKPKWLGAPSRMADPELSQVLTALLDQLAPEVSSPATIVARARSALADMLGADVPSVDVLAQRLRMRSRTLQHQLSREGYTYSRLVDDVRRAIVLDVLRDDGVTLDEITWRAGYRSQSAFFRAFRRWTGTTPAAYRRERSG